MNLQPLIWDTLQCKAITNHWPLCLPLLNHVLVTAACYKAAAPHEIRLICYDSVFGCLSGRCRVPHHPNNNIISWRSFFPLFDELLLSCITVSDVYVSEWWYQLRVNVLITTPSNIYSPTGCTLPCLFSLLLTQINRKGSVSASSEPRYCWMLRVWLISSLTLEQSSCTRSMTCCRSLLVISLRATTSFFTWTCRSVPSRSTWLSSFFRESYNERMVPDL